MPGTIAAKSKRPASLVQQLADKPFALIGVNSDEEIEVARKSVEDLNINWRSFWNGEEGTFGPSQQNGISKVGRQLI